MPLASRNFGEADYEALLELDSQPVVARPQLSEAELGRLQTHIHRLKAEAPPKRLPRLLPGTTSGCTDKVHRMCNCTRLGTRQHSLLTIIDQASSLAIGPSLPRGQSQGLDISKAGGTKLGRAACSKTR